VDTNQFVASDLFGIVRGQWRPPATQTSHIALRQIPDDNGRVGSLADTRVGFTTSALPRKADFPDVIGDRSNRSLFLENNSLFSSKFPCSLRREFRSERPINIRFVDLQSVGPGVKTEKIPVNFPVAREIC
jgi:hypothetical protein